MVLELSLAESVAEFSAELWAELEGPAAYPFLRREWLSAFEESDCLGADRGWVPRHLVVKQGGEILAVAPAYIKLHSMGEFVFDQGWAEFSEARLGKPYFPKLIVAVPFTPATGPRILFQKSADAADREAVFDLLTGALPELAEKLGLSSVHVLFPDESNAAPLRDRGWAERLGIQFQFHNPGHECFDDFLGSFRSKRRAAMRRECRELEASGVKIEVLTGTSLGLHHAPLAHSLYLTTIDKHVWGRRYLNRGFFERVIRDMPEHLHFVVARDSQGEPLAGAFNLLGEQALYGRYWGSFVDMPFLHFNVCLYEGVRETIARRLQRFEPGAGGGHKEGRGFRPTVTRSLHYLHDPRLSLAVKDFCQRESDAVRDHVAASLEP